MKVPVLFPIGDSYRWNIYRVGHLTFGIWIGYKKNLWIFFQKYGFIRKIKPFHLPSWKRSIGKYWIQYYFREKVWDF